MLGEKPVIGAFLQGLSPAYSLGHLLEAGKEGTVTEEGHIGSVMMVSPLKLSGGYTGVLYVLFYSAMG